LRTCGVGLSVRVPKVALPALAQRVAVGQRLGRRRQAVVRVVPADLEARSGLGIDRGRVADGGGVVGEQGGLHGGRFEEAPGRPRRFQLPRRQAHRMSLPKSEPLPWWLIL
jgi:hypothetical protein